MQKKTKRKQNNVLLTFAICCLDIFICVANFNVIFSLFRGNLKKTTHFYYYCLEIWWNKSKFLFCIQYFCGNQLEILAKIRKAKESENLIKFSSSILTFLVYSSEYWETCFSFSTFYLHRLGQIIDKQHILTWLQIT